MSPHKKGEAFFTLEIFSFQNFLIPINFIYLFILVGAKIGQMVVI
jgi:hypothetical protein